MAIEKTRKSAAIDLIRGVSIFYIVGYWHLFNYTNAVPAYKNPVTECLTVIALSLFVFISGFLLAGGVGGRAFPGTVDFLKTRFLKIYPPFALTALVFLAFRFVDGPIFLRSVALLSTFWGPSPYTIWFIGMIAVFYLATPLLVRMARYSSMALLAGSAAIFFVFAILCGYSPSADQRVLLYFPSFVLGIWLAHHRDSIGVRAGFTALAVCMASVALLMWRPGIEPQYSPYFAPLALAGAVAVYVWIMPLSLGPALQRVAIRMAVPSYMMFLIHRPVYAVMKKVYFPANGAAQVVYLICVCLPVVYLGAVWAQRGYDAFFRRVMSRA